MQLVFMTIVMGTMDHRQSLASSIGPAMCNGSAFTVMREMSMCHCMKLELAGYRQAAIIDRPLLIAPYRCAGLVGCPRLPLGRLCRIQYDTI